MALIKFYFQYNRDVHQAKIVIQEHDSAVQTTLHVDQIICRVITWTERADVGPRFVVRGECKDYLIDESTGEKVIILV